METKTDYKLTATAVADFCRIVGQDPGDAATEQLRREFGEARFVKKLDSGAESWRGRRPRRLSFVVHVEDGRMVVGRVMGEHRGSQVLERRRSVELLVDGEQRTFEVLDVVYEPGGGRRVAYKLASGVWAVGARGAQVGHVQGLSMLDEAPEWASKKGA